MWAAGAATHRGSDLFRESGAMFAAGTDRGAGKAREHCDVVVGADLVYSADVVEKLCKTIVALGCSRVYYCAPSTGRAGSQEFLERLEKLGFDRNYGQMRLRRTPRRRVRARLCISRT